jgi:hypothetical protein
MTILVNNSKIVLIGDMGDVEGLASILGCKVVSLPIIYLGLSLGASYKDSTILNGIVEKIEYQLAGWKRLYLSKRGGLTSEKEKKKRKKKKKKEKEHFQIYQLIICLFALF